MKDEYRVSEANERDRVTGKKVEYFIVEGKLVHGGRPISSWIRMYGFGDAEEKNGTRYFSTREKAEECIKNLMEE